MTEQSDPFVRSASQISQARDLVFWLLGWLTTCAALVSLIVQGFDVHLVGITLEAYERYLALRDFVFGLLHLQIPSPLKDTITIYLMGAAAWQFTFRRLVTVHLGVSDPDEAPHTSAHRALDYASSLLWPKMLFRKIAICLDWRISWPVGDMEEWTAPTMVGDFARYLLYLAFAVAAFFISNTISSNYGPLV